jgi:hypothetical protein
MYLFINGDSEALERKRQELIDRLIMKGDDGEKKKIAEIGKMLLEHQVNRKLELRI